MNWVSQFSFKAGLLCVLFVTGLCSPQSARADRPMGIDTSHWNGTINWATVYANGFRFAFTKASESSDWTDDSLVTNMANAKAAGLVIGPYHFGRPEYGNSATTEANHFVAVAGQYMTNGYLPPVLDLETGSGLGKTALSTWVNTFCNRIKILTGVSPIVYTGQSFASSYLNSTVTNWNLWLAQWPCSSCVWPCTTCTANMHTSDALCTPWSRWTFWQNQGEVSSMPGVPSTTDWDVFKGTLAELYSYVIGGGTNPPTINVQPANVTVATNGSANFVVGAFGGGTLYYRWQKSSPDGPLFTNLNNGGHYSGVFTAELLISNADGTDAAKYRCVVTNAYSSATSSNATLTLAVSCEPNALVNADFEGCTNSGVACGWTSYEVNSPTTKVWSIQTFEPPEGSHWQQIQAYNAAHTASAGVRQDVTGCTIGATYRVAGWYKSNSANGRARVRLSPSASTSWSTAIDLSPAQEVNGSTWTAFSGTVVAMGPSMTIWLDGQTTGGTSAKVGCFDAVTVTCEGLPVPLHIDAVNLLAQQQVHLLLSGPVENLVSIQRSSNLVHWVTLTTLTNTTGTLEFTDTTTSNRLQWFYRAVTP